MTGTSAETQATPSALKARWLWLRAAAPGIGLCFVIAAAAMYFSSVLGGPSVIYALLIGIGLHVMSRAEACVRGIEISAKKILNIGIALLGVRVTFDQIAALGTAPILTVIACLALTLGAGWFTARLLGLRAETGIITGGATAICGASAALALSAALRKPGRVDEGLERDTLFTVIAVTALSTLAMMAYPAFLSLFSLSDTATGMVLGATIHNVPQAVGAGYAVSPEAGDTATYVKLMRVGALPVLVIAIALAVSFQTARSAEAGTHQNKGALAKAAATFPWFALAFAAILSANSLGLIPEPVRAVMEEASRWCLTAAIAALGLKTSFTRLLSLGPLYLVLIGAETLFLLALASGLIIALG